MAGEALTESPAKAHVEIPTEADDVTLAEVLPMPEVAAPSRPLPHHLPAKGEDDDELASYGLPLEAEVPATAHQAFGAEDAASSPGGVLLESLETIEALDSSPATSGLRHSSVRLRVPIPPRPTRTSQTFWKLLAVGMAILLVASGTAAFIYLRFTQPAKVASVFCHDLQARDYAQAYSLLDSGATHGLSKSQFVTAARTLDTAAGAITACGQQSGGSAYSYRLGGQTASVGLSLTRASGARFQGTLRLANQDGAWKITSADTSLFGANLAALTVANAYCADLRARDYAAAYKLLDASTQRGISANDFTQQAQAHDTLDGPVTACAIVGLSTATPTDATSGHNTPKNASLDQSATLTETVTRQILGQRQGMISLTFADHAWRLRSIDGALQGSDLGGLQVVQRFCGDLGQHNYGDAYGLLSANLESQSGGAGAMAALWSGQDGLAWLGCVPQMPTYAVSGTSATVTVQLIVRNTFLGQQNTGPVLFHLVRDTSGWRIDNITFVSSASVQGGIGG